MKTNDEYNKSTLNDRVLVVMNDLKKRFDEDNLCFDYEFGLDKYVALHDLVGHKAIILNNEKRTGLNYTCTMFINQFQFENTYELCRSEIFKQKANKYTRPYNWKDLQKLLAGVIRKKGIKLKGKKLLELLNCFEPVKIKILKDKIKSNNLIGLKRDIKKKINNSGFYIKSVYEITGNSYWLKFSEVRLDKQHKDL